MKKKEILLFSSLLVLAIAAWIAMSAYRRTRDTGQIRISVAGEEFGVYSLGKDQEIAIGDTNVCRIENGAVTMISATCPDKLCMHQPAVNQNGGVIICLPNQVVIEGISAPKTTDNSPGAQGAASDLSSGNLKNAKEAEGTIQTSGDDSLKTAAQTDPSGNGESAKSKDFQSGGSLAEEDPYTGWDKKARVSNTGFFLDTVITITLYGTDDSSLIKDCFSLIADYEALLSRTKEGSDIWNVNHSEGKPVQVSADTAELLSLALHFCALCDGAFDITIAPAVDLWDFHEEGSHSLPDSYLLNQAVSHVDYHGVTIEGTTVTLKDPDAKIDLGGIAKGFIADQLKAFLLEKKIPGAMIDLGGNILAVGQKPDGSPWHIGIRRPFGETASDLIATAQIPEGSVVTSGIYERYFEKNGELYHHLLDSSTGYPAETGLLSVSIYSDSSAEGDALSTSCFLLGQEKGLELIESLDGIEALFVLDDYTLVKSSGFPG